MLAAALAIGCGTDVPRGAGGDAGASPDGGRDAGAVDATPDAGVDATEDAFDCDLDGDGFRAIACGGNDCDDADPFASPGSAERCDGTLADDTTLAADHDEDCNPCTIAAAGRDGDADSDGYRVTSCSNPYRRVDDLIACDTMFVLVDAAAMTVSGSDCNDDAPSGGASVHPNQVEVCGNHVDDNCDGGTDTGTFYRDVDRDMRGDPSVLGTTCAAGWVTNSDDCDDLRSETYLGAREMCDRLDNDCSNAIDPGGLEPLEDGDDDRHSPVSAACLGYMEPGALGWAFVKDDCNDGEATIYTGADEICPNGVDENCDAIVDNPSRSVCTDMDRDGHGVGALMTVAGCGPPPDQLVDATHCSGTERDCDDGDAEVHPGQTEICNGRDDDCSSGGGAAPEEDGDGDRYAPATVTCRGLGELGAPLSAFPRTDCRDDDRLRHPGADEHCDGQDFDCSTPAPGAGVLAPDEDADGDGHSPIGASCIGFGEPDSTGADYPEDDCLDTRATVHPGVPASADTTTCDGLDNDCNPFTTEIGVVCSSGGYCNEGAVCGRRPHVVQLAVGGGVFGGGFTCALSSDGTVSCWGSNSYGQLGDGTRIDRLVPVTIPGLAGVVQIEAASNHMCARLVDGTVWCWGGNYAGQLGLGDNADRSSPTAPVVGLAGARDISANGEHSCAVLADGSVACWGNGNFGQLGNSDGTNHWTPFAVPGVAGAVEVEAGRIHTCVRTGDGTVQCFGDTPAIAGSAPGRAISGLAGVTQIDAGSGHTCALLSDGTASCWGNGREGEIGDGAGVTRRNPTAVTGLTGVVEIRAGTYHVCARLTDGTVQCWGANNYGQLGDGTSTNRPSPTVISGLTRVDELAAANHTCARLRDGSVRCWGYNRYGQLGDRTTEPAGTYVADHLRPTVGPALFGSAIELSTGRGHTCARLVDRTVTCWGNIVSSAATPLHAVPVETLVGAVQLADGDGHTCALRVDGTVACWGFNDYLALGDGTTTPRYTSIPGTVTMLSGVVEVAAGVNHTCARLMDGTLRCWGSNDQGQLGDGTRTDSSVPRTVLVASGGAALSGVVAITAGEFHSCARLSGGTVRCWGGNAFGQIGDGTMTRAPYPASVLTAPGGAALSGVVEISAGHGHTCARLGDRTVVCWGLNDQGQLGTGTMATRTTATVVPALASVLQISAGGAHTCARVTGSTLRCWGANWNGQLGDGTRTNSATPVTVLTAGGTALGSIGDVSARAHHTCVRRASDGSLRCWGDNDSGQAGNWMVAIDGQPTPVVVWDL